MIFKDIDLKELFELMQANEVTDLNLRDGKITIEIKRHSGALLVSPTGGVATVPVSVTSVENGTGGIDGTTTAMSETGESPTAGPSPETAHFVTVRAPLVGTFYRSPSPDSPPFVEVGDSVRKGDVLCIIEAMKSMNEIQAESGGIIREICSDNAQLVEYEQPLFRIEP